MKIDSTPYDNGGGGVGTTASGSGFQNVSAGSSSVGELADSSATDLANYDKAISCDNSKGSNTGAASLTTNALAYGEQVTCTITNSRLPQIKLVKNIIPNSDTGRFDLKINSTTYNNSGSGYGDTGTTDFQNMSSGTITVSELGHTGTSLTGYDASISCDSSKGGNSGQTTYSFSAAYGQKVTCTFTNTRHAYLTINKTALGGNNTFNFTGSGT